MRQLAIFGIDGGSFSVLKPLLETSQLPHLARVLEGGSGGYLESTIPPVTIPAWPSMSTGLHPGGHGCCSFDSFAPGDKKRSFSQIGSGDLGRPALWDQVGAAGGESLIINIPGTYPARALPGAIVTGMFTPSPETACIHPERLRAPLAKRLGGEPWKTWDFPGRTTPRRIRREIAEVEDSKFETLVFLDEEVPEWKLLWVVFQGGDALQHLLKGRREDLLRDYFRQIDGYLGWILERMEPEGHLMVVSDHGFAPMRYEFVISHWLREEGFLAFSENREVGSREGLLSRLASGTRKLFHSPRLEICWEKTRAFPCGYGIRLSIRDREPGGVLEPGREAEAVAGEIVALLKRVKNPFTGEKACSLVARREDLYSGPFLDRVPDILLRFRGDETLISMKRRKGPWNRRWGKPWHHPDGIFFLAGPGARRESGAPSFRARIVDVAPTALHLMGLEVPSGLDGRVLEERLRPEFMAENPVRHSESLPVMASPGSAFSRREQWEVEARLKSLGYL